MTRRWAKTILTVSGALALLVVLRLGYTVAQLRAASSLFAAAAALDAGSAGASSFRNGAADAGAGIPVDVGLATGAATAESRVIPSAAPYLPTAAPPAVREQTTTLTEAVERNPEIAELLDDPDPTVRDSTRRFLSDSLE